MARSAVAAPAVSLGLPAYGPDFAAITDAPVVDLYILAELRPWSVTAGDVVVLRLSDRGFASPANDTPAHTYWHPLLREVAWSRRTSGRRLGGRGDFRGGTLSFTGIDQAIEVGGATYTIPAFLREFSIDGRDIEIRACDARGWASGVRLYRGTATEWSAGSGRTVTVALKGAAYRLDTPLQPATYDGTSTYGGGPELSGKRKPLAFGRCRNVTPPLSRASHLIYDLHTDAAGNGAPIHAVTAARIGGVLLQPTLDYPTTASLAGLTTGPGQSIEPGEYATCLAEGRIRLGATPGAAFTVDVSGAVEGGTLIEKPGAVMRQAAINYGPRMHEIDESSFANLSAVRPYAVNRWVGPGEDLTAAALLDEIAESVEAAWGDARDGRLQAYPISPPTNVGQAISLMGADVQDASFEWQALPADVRPALREVTVGYSRNYTPTTDLGVSVQGDARTALEQEWRTTVAAQTVARHAEATTLRADTLLTDLVDAEAFAATLLALYDGGTRRVRLAATRRAMQAQPASQAALVLTQEAVDTRIRVLGVSVDTASGLVEIEGILRDG